VVLVQGLDEYVDEWTEKLWAPLTATLQGLTPDGEVQAIEEEPEKVPRLYHVAQGLFAGGFMGGL
jgi:hypothetical protein